MTSDSLRMAKRAARAMDSEAVSDLEWRCSWGLIYSVWALTAGGFIWVVMKGGL